MSAKCEEHSGVCEAIATLKKSDAEQWVVIRKIQNRPPVWTTLLLTVMGGGIGWAFTYASFAVKLAAMTVAGK